MEQYGLFIDGNWTEFKPENSFETNNPATGAVLAAFNKATKEDVIAAVDAAEAAFPAWKRFPAPRRGEIILRAAHIMQERKDELGELVTLEMGKVIAEGKTDVYTRAAKF